MFDATVLGLEPRELLSIGDAIDQARQSTSEIATFACDIGSYELRLENLRYDKFL